MKLKEIPEATEIKQNALEKVAEWSTIERESTIAFFSSSSNYLPKYLWRYWSEELKSEGISWQVFLRVIRTCKRSIIDWVDEKLSWSELLKVIENKLTSLKDGGSERK